VKEPGTRKQGSAKQAAFSRLHRHRFNRQSLPLWIISSTLGRDSPSPSHRQTLVTPRNGLPPPAPLLPFVHAGAIPPRPQVPGSSQPSLNLLTKFCFKSPPTRAREDSAEPPQARVQLLPSEQPPDGAGAQAQLSGRPPSPPAVAAVARTAGLHKPLRHRYWRARPSSR